MAPFSTIKDKVTTATSGFSKPFWVVNTMELFERGAYYGMMAVLARHMEKNLGFESWVIGLLFSILLVLLYFVPIVAAALAEKYGYRETFIVAFLLMILGYFISFFIDQPYQFLLTICLFGIGAGAFKPMVSATVAHVTTVDQRNLGYSIYYWLINFGAFLVPLVFSFIFYESIYEYAFIVATAMIIVNLGIAIFIFESPIEQKPDKSVGEVFKSAALVLGDRRFVILLLVYSGFWFMFSMNHSFLPLYLKNFAIMPDWFQTTHLATINPGTIILLGPFLGKWAEKYDSLKMMILGISIFVIGFAIIGFSAGISVEGVRWAIFPAAIILFSIGEFITHPNFISYTSKIAPKDKVAVYMGYIFVPIGLGQVTGTAVGGFLYGHFAEDLNQPQIFWAFYCCVGLVTISGMILYHRKFGVEMSVSARQEADRGDILEAEAPDDRPLDDLSHEVAHSPLALFAQRLWKPIPLVGVAFVAMILLLAAAAASPKLTFYEDEDEKKGIYLWQAEVIHSEEELFRIVETVNEGETIQGEAFNDTLHIYEYVVQFTWQNLDTDFFAPDVRLEVWSGNDSRPSVIEEDTAFGGTITVHYLINENEKLMDGNMTAKATKPSTLIEKFEKEPETVYVEATYVDDNNDAPGHPQERLEFTITIDVVTWEMENIKRAPR